MKVGYSLSHSLTQSPASPISSFGVAEEAASELIVVLKGSSTLVHFNEQLWRLRRPIL